MNLSEQKTIIIKSLISTRDFLTDITDAEA